MAPVFCGVFVGGEELVRRIDSSIIGLSITSSYRNAALSEAETCRIGVQGTF
jgi:hypothetical protein